MKKTKKILIAGGAGFIGSNLARRLQRKYKVFVFDNFLTGNWRNLDGVDCCLTYDVKQHFDAIVNLASITNTGRTGQTKNNVEIQEILLDAHPHTPFVYASSASVYGNRGSNAPFREDMDLKPESEYSWSKTQLERLANRNRSAYRVNPVGLRFFNVYGPGEEFKGTSASMVSQISNKAEDNLDILLFGDGRQVRDFIHVDRICDLIDIVLDRLQSLDHFGRPALQPKHSVYNAGTGRSISFNRIVEILAKTTDFETRIKYIKNDFAPQFQDFTQADASRAVGEFGWNPGKSDGSDSDIWRFFKEEDKRV
jgi:ADP-L-glycero-D-manno-heptose 6-epimerase